jgi:hypothetical protein
MGKAKVKRASKGIKKISKNILQRVFIQGCGLLPEGNLGETMAKRICAGDDFYPVSDGKTCVALFGDDDLHYGADLILEVFGTNTKHLPDYRFWVEQRAKTASTADQEALIEGAANPLHVAVAQGLVDLAKQIIEVGGDPNALFKLQGMEDFELTPLDFAAQYIVAPEVAMDVVQLLFGKGAKATRRALELFSKDGFEAVQALVEDKLLADTDSVGAGRRSGESKNLL